MSSDRQQCISIHSLVTKLIPRRWKGSLGFRLNVIPQGNKEMDESFQFHIFTIIMLTNAGLALIVIHRFPA